MSFYIMKSNSKDISPKRPFKILKDLLKSKKLNQTDPITIHFYSHSNKKACWTFEKYNQTGYLGKVGGRRKSVGTVGYLFVGCTELNKIHTTQHQSRAIE